MLFLRYLSALLVDIKGDSLELEVGVMSESWKLQWQGRESVN